jgi:predicted nucleic acid-binding protein
VAVTAVDASVILDVFSNHPQYAARSKAALEAALQQGVLVVCPVVYAEVRAHFADDASLRAALGAAAVQFDPFDQACADLAGDIWRVYRSRGGTRTRLIPDFLVGAHAQLRAKRILSRDRGFLRAYFKDLVVLDPTEASPRTSSGSSRESRR